MIWVQIPTGNAWSLIFSHFSSTGVFWCFLYVWKSYDSYCRQHVKPTYISVAKPPIYVLLTVPTYLENWRSQWSLVPIYFPFKIDRFSSKFTFTEFHNCPTQSLNAPQRVISSSMLVFVQIACELIRLLCTSNYLLFVMLIFMALKIEC